MPGRPSAAVTGPDAASARYRPSSRPRCTVSTSAAVVTSPTIRSARRSRESVMTVTVQDRACTPRTARVRGTHARYPQKYVDHRALPVHRDGVEFRVLGPVEAWSNGRAVCAPAGRQRALLAALVLRR